MVADSIAKVVPRSLVRVPGSGRGQGPAAPAVSCDLGRVSSLAASIIVNPNLPAIMAGSRILVVPSVSSVSKNKLATSGAQVGLPGIPVDSTHRRAFSPEEGDDAGQESKRPRLDASSPPANDGSSSNPGMERANVHPTQPQEVVASGAGQEGQQLSTTRRLATARRTISQQDVSSRTFEELQQEQNRLREENRGLLQQLAYYIRLSQARTRQTLLAPGSAV